MLILSLSVFCQAEPLTEPFIVGSNDHTVSDLPLDDKRHRNDNYRIKINFIDSISWQWLYAANLLVTLQLILSGKDASLSSNLYPWLSVETIIVVGWLLKSNRSPDSALFMPLEQQARFMLTEVDLSFAINTMMPGSEPNQAQAQPSESSIQQAPQITTYPIGYFTSLLYSDFDDGNEAPQQHSHTLGLNCFVHPCNDVCQFRKSSDSSDSGALECRESSADHTGATLEQSSTPHQTNTQFDSFDSTDGVALDGVALDGVALDGIALNSKVTLLADTTNPPQQTICRELLVGKDGQLQQCGKVAKNERALSSHKSSYHTGQKTCELTVAGENGQRRPCKMTCQNAQALYAHKKIVHSGQKTCDFTVVREDGRKRVCAMVCKNAQSLWNHKSKNHGGEQTCRATLVTEDGLQQPCGKIYKNFQALFYHRRKEHTGIQTCNTTVVGEDGQSRPCGMTCKNLVAIGIHRSIFHSGQQTCDEALVGKDGQQRPCGTVCKNASILSVHKSKVHSGQKTCDVAVVEKDGQQRPCGRVCKSAHALWDHKSKIHSGQKTCDATVVVEDGQQRPCGKVCKNARTLTNHYRRDHSGPKACEVTVIGEDGQQRPCGKVCENLQALSNHKRIHRKRKPFDVNLDNDLNP
ncbi:hypothetical protein [Endozoicomonas sp. ALC020]|uniref:hypothetical protein n=1 Tax=unclassified Endozoicomonas TaxID=2644528 RepID=UPI003BAEBA0C